MSRKGKRNLHILVRHIKYCICSIEEKAIGKVDVIQVLTPRNLAAEFARPNRYIYYVVFEREREREREGEKERE